MSELRIIPVTFGGERATVTDYRIKHDWGQVYKFLDIDLPDVFEARFSNATTGASIPQIGTDNMVEIPAQFFESGAPIYCYITLHDEETDGRTVYTVKTPISPSSDRTDAEPEPEEESIITQAITALNNAVDVTSQKASEASDSADRAEQAAEGIEAYVERAEAAQNASESARDKAEEAKASAQESATATTEGLNEVRYYVDIINKAYVKIDDWTQISHGASQQAIASEQASAENAQQASQSAETASQKASEASQSAYTASNKASEAAQSAQTATQAKTDAESAKIASQTAQGLAESARNEAVTAKADAESARDEAQSIANGITGKVEQIDSNTERIESLEDDRYKPYPTDTASGSIASFPDGADDIPLKSCIVQVEPVQAGSGDPSPDNVRPITGWTGCEIKHSGEDTSNPTTYPITFPSEAGTVYGAYVDVTGGELVVDRTIVDLGTLKWSVVSNNNYATFSCASVFKGAVYNANVPTLICSTYKSGANNTVSPTDDNYVWFNPQKVLRLKDTTRKVLTAEQFKTAMSGVQLCYELATPIHYPLTPTEIKTLLGTNNVWANTGDTSVTYRADTTLYIKRLTDSDTDMVADANIVSGQYFMVGNDLYRATVNISSGANVIEGTNATKVSLATALNEINA